MPSTQMIECIAWRPMEKNTLLGFATLRLASGLIIVDATLHQKNGARWVSMPARPWTDTQGITRYASIIDFIDKETRDRFSKTATAAIDAFVTAQGQHQPQPVKKEDPWAGFGDAR
jgi:hypothetical protein